MRAPCSPRTPLTFSASPRRAARTSSLAMAISRLEQTQSSAVQNGTAAALDLEPRPEQRQPLVVSTTEKAPAPSLGCWRSYGLCDPHFICLRASCNGCASHQTQTSTAVPRSPVRRLRQMPATHPTIAPRTHAQNPAPKTGRRRRHEPESLSQRSLSRYAAYLSRYKSAANTNTRSADSKS
eukprot:3472196-Prymnesium_polylepis.1